MGEDTKPYRLRPGKKHWVGNHENGRYVGDEAVVDLTERQAVAFADKFVAYEGNASASAPTPQAPKQAPAPSTPKAPTPAPPPPPPPAPPAKA